MAIPESAEIRVLRRPRGNPAEEGGRAQIIAIRVPAALGGA